MPSDNLYLYGYDKLLQGNQYVVDSRNCRVRPAPGVMNEMCIPGTNIPLVSSLHFHDDVNVSTK